MEAAEFEEKEYEGPLYHELELGSRYLWSPGQVLEFHLGYDRAAFLTEAYLFKLHGHQGPLKGIVVSRFAWPVLPTAPNFAARLPPFRLNCFIQAKRPEIGRRLSSRLAALGPVRPFYRFRITPHQQRNLYAASDRLHGRALFVYASPVFGTARELFKHIGAGTIVENSSFPDVEAMEGHANWYYNEPGASGIPNQGEDRVDLGSLDERLSARAFELRDEESFGEENLAALANGVVDLLSDEEFSAQARGAYLAQEWRDIGVYADANELPRMAIDYLRVMAFSAYFNVRWLTVL